MNSRINCSDCRLQTFLQVELYQQQNLSDNIYPKFHSGPNQKNIVHGRWPDLLILSEVWIKFYFISSLLSKFN